MDEMTTKTDVIEIGEKVVIHVSISEWSFFPSGHGTTYYFIAGTITEYFPEHNVYEIETSRMTYRRKRQDISRLADRAEEVERLLDEHAAARNRAIETDREIAKILHEQLADKWDWLSG